MGTDIIPYEPYHPHLGYTLVAACLAWLVIGVYNRRLLKRQPQLRVVLYGFAIGMPIYAEACAYLITRLRPAPDTPLGYFLTHFHARFIERFPIDSFLSPAMSVLLITALAGLVMLSLGRFAAGTLRLNRALRLAVPLARSPYNAVLARLLASVRPQYSAPPPLLVCELAVPLAFTTGLLRPRIYISSALLKLLSTDEAVAVLCHEWAHVLRRDTLWNWLVRLQRDVVWFLPSSHMAWRAMAASQDEACDALAARMTRQPLVLARALVKVARTQVRGELPPLVVASSFAQPGTAPRARVEQMLRLSELRQPPGRASAIGAASLAVLMMILVVLPVLLGS